MISVRKQGSNIDAFDSLYHEPLPDAPRFIDEVAEEFTQLLNDWHSQPEVYDSLIDSQIHAWYMNPPKVFPEKPYFSPSSAGSDMRELYFRGIGEKAESTGQQPHQKRWTSIGTAIGDIIQRDLLFIEKHGEEKLGYKPRFIFARNRNKQPMFEEFAKKNHSVTHNGVTFNITGSPDGVMIYETDDGQKLRIGLEIKSKQTTAAKTSQYSLQQAEEKHVEQVTAYSIMFDLDFYLIIYVNTAHKSWSMTPEDFESTPDMRVFGIECTKERKNALLDRLAYVQDCINKRIMPEMDLYKWTFNSFKTQCALSMTEEELAAAEEEARRLKKSRAPAYVKNGFIAALAEIKEIRNSFVI